MWGRGPTPPGKDTPMEKTLFTTPKCPHCKTPSTMIVDGAAFKSWKAGAYIQDAFPDLDEDQRETIKTGFHPTCWNIVFGDKSELF